MFFLFDFFTLFRLIILLINALAIINEKRVLGRCNKLYKLLDGMDKPDLSDNIN